MKTYLVIIMKVEIEITEDNRVRDHVYQGFLAILHSELIPALGCTEPIAIAYASAKARNVLGSIPEHIIVECSGNIIKNVKGVIVPTTENMKGIDTSAILGAVGGDPDGKLEVLKDITPEHIKETKELLNKGICEVKLLSGSSNLHIIVTATKGSDTATVEIKESHTNIVSIKKNGVLIEQQRDEVKQGDGCNTIETASLPKDQLTLERIYEFANTVKIEDVSEVLSRQIDYNLKIANEGLTNSYGANVGKTIVKNYGNDVKMLAKAYPAAGSDARMGGCTLPVIINSGSGNQGMTVSLPVIVYAHHLNSSKEQLYRALVLSNLIAIHLKSGIGKLSAYCGVVSAACGSGAAISYLCNASFDTIAKTITNVLGNVSGIVCDGAKSSCAAKIASAVDAALMGHYLAMDDNTYGAGEGLVKENIERTIETISQMGRVGMKETDVEILNLMIEN